MREDKKELSVAAGVGEIVLPLSGDWIAKNMDGGFYYQSRLSLLRLGLAFSNEYSKNPALDYNQRVLNAVKELAIDEFIGLVISKFAGAPLATADTILTFLDHIVVNSPNYSAKLFDKFQEQIKAEKIKNPNYKLTFSERLMMNRLSDPRAKEEMFKGYVKGYNQARNYIKNAVKKLITPEPFHLDDLNFMIAMGLALANSNINSFMEEFIKNKEGQALIKQLKGFAKKNGMIERAKLVLKKENEKCGISEKELTPQKHLELFQIVNEYNEAIRIKKTEEIDYKKMHSVLSSIKNVGIALKNKNLEKFGRAGELGTTIIANLKKLGVIIPEGRLLDVFNPLKVAFFAGFSLIKLFNRPKDQKQEFDQVLLKEVYLISSQLQELHQEIRLNFQQVYQSQAQILRTLINGVNYLERVLKEETYDLRFALTVQLDKISSSITRLQELMIQQNLQQFLQPLPVILQKAKIYIDDPKKSSQDAIIEIGSELIVWSSNYACAPILNGLDHMNISYANDPDWISQNLHFKRNELSSFLAFIGASVQELAKEDFPSDINIKKLIHPDVWLAAISRYLQLTSLFPAWLPETVTESLMLGSNYLRFMSYLRENTGLHEKLVKNYSEKLIEVKQNWDKIIFLEISNSMIDRLNSRWEESTKICWPEHASYSSALQLTNDIDDFYENYQIKLMTYVRIEKDLFEKSENFILSQLINGELMINDIAAKLSSPLFCFARHSLAFRREDYFGINYVTAARTNAHVINVTKTVQEFGFDFPLWIKSIFTNGDLNFPKELYLAERLGIIEFSYEFRAVSQGDNFTFAFDVYLQMNIEEAWHYGTIHCEIQSIETAEVSSLVREMLQKLQSLYMRYHITTPSGPFCGLMDNRLWPSVLFYRIFVAVSSFELMTPKKVFLQEKDSANNQKLILRVREEIEQKVIKIRENILSLQLAKSSKMQPVIKSLSLLNVNYYLLATVLRLIREDKEDKSLETYLSTLWNAEKLTNYWKEISSKDRIFPEELERERQLENILTFMSKQSQEASSIEQAISALQWSMAMNYPEQYLKMTLNNADEKLYKMAYQIASSKLKNDELTSTDLITPQEENLVGDSALEYKPMFARL